MKDQEFEEHVKKYMGDVYPESSAELKKLIDKVVNTQHDYNTSAEAIVKVLVLAAHYVYHKLGNTGFQASWADLEFLSINRRMKNGFRIFDAEQLLLKELKPVAQELLKEKDLNLVSPNVMARWKEIAEQ
jgi:hypothetical protein